MGYTISVFYHFISGAVMMGFWVTGAFFIRAWKKTQERILGIFGFAFWIMALERLILELSKDPNSERYALIYLIRLAAFVVILIGIVDVNRQERRRIS